MNALDVQRDLALLGELLAALGAGVAVDDGSKRK